MLLALSRLAESVSDECAGQDLEDITSKSLSTLSLSSTPLPKTSLAGASLAGTPIPRRPPQATIWNELDLNPRQKGYYRQSSATFFPTGPADVQDWKPFRAPPLPKTCRQPRLQQPMLMDQPYPTFPFFNCLRTKKPKIPENVAILAAMRPGYSSTTNLHHEVKILDEPSPMSWTDF